MISQCLSCTNLPTGRETTVGPGGCQDASSHVSVGQETAVARRWVELPGAACFRGGPGDRHPPLWRLPPGRRPFEESVYGNGFGWEQDRRRHRRGLHVGHGASLLWDGRMESTATKYWWSPIVAHAVPTQPASATSSGLCTALLAAASLGDEAFARTFVRWRRVRRRTNPAGHVDHFAFSPARSLLAPARARTPRRRRVVSLGAGG
jgi:hypothetical protein